MRLPASITRLEKPVRLVTVTIGIGLVISLLLYTGAQRWEWQRINSDFLRHAENRVSAIRLTIQERMADAEIMAFVLATSDSLTIHEFKRLTEKLIEKQPSLQAVGWIPRIEQGDKEETELAARRLFLSDPAAYRLFSEFQIRERASDGQLIPVHNRAAYYPAYFVQPLEGNESLVGFDVATDEFLGKTLERALHRRGPAATARTQTQTSRAEQYTFKVFVPVYNGYFSRQRGGAKTGLEHPLGVLCETFRVGDLADASWHHLQPVGLDKLILDLSAPDQERYLYTQWSRLHHRPKQISRPLSEWRSGLYYEAKFPVADREWSAIIKAAPTFITARKTHVPEFLLLAGLVLTGTVASYLGFSAKRAIQLGKTNELLRSEVLERERVERDLREQHETLHAIVETVPLMMTLIGPDAKTRWVNRAWRDTLQWSLEETQGGTLLEDMYPDPDYRREVTAFLERADGTWRDLKTRVRNGTVLDTSWASVRLSDGALVRLGKDMTETKSLEKRLLRAQRLESIGTLAAGMAHDLNNILTPVMMSAQILQLKKPPRDEAQMLAMVVASAQRGADIVRHVLTFARGIEGHHACIRPGELLDEMQRLLRQTFPKNITLTSTAPDGMWTVNGDATQLHQVLMNLCVNARDAMPDGGELSISAENVQITREKSGLFADGKPGPHVVFRVSDTGHGISTAILEKIFDPFFTTKKLGEGTGLGLSTVLGIVRSHEGFLDVQTAAGKGTTFQVYLPAQFDPVEVTSTSCEPSVPRGTGECILVVDDEENIRTVTRCTLASHGYEVLLAANGKQGLEMVSEHGCRVKAVITDIMMPEMDGVSMIQALRQTYSQLPVIACTGWGQDGVRARLKSLGVESVLQKPYSSEALLNTLRQHLDLVCAA